MLFKLFVFIMVAQGFANYELTLQMSKQLNIQHCLKITNSMKNKLAFIKTMSENFIFASTSHAEKISAVVNYNTPLKTLVSLNEDDLQKANQQLPCNVFWLMERNKVDRENITPVSTYIPFSCNFWLAQNTSVVDKSIAQLYTIYQTREENKQIISFYRNYSVENGFGSYLDIPTTSRRNLFGTYFVLYAGDGNICQFKVVCAHFMLLQDISQSLNFIIKKINSTQRMEMKDKVDLEHVVASIYNQPPRDLIAPSFHGWVNMYIKDTFGSHGDEWLAFSRPFSTDVWIIVFVWLLGVSLLVTIVSYFLLGRNKALIVDSIFAVLDSLCCQGGSIVSVRRESRWSILMPRLLGQVLVPAYSAAVISFITIHITSLPFQDLTGFLMDGSYKWSCLRVDIFSQNYFRGSASKELQAVAKLQEPDEKNPMNYSDSIQRLCNEKKFAMMSHDRLIEKEYSPCKIVRIPEHIAPTMGGMPLSHKSPYREAFKWVMFKMRMTGCIDKMMKALMWSPIPSQEARFYPIDEPQIVVPFSILAIGFILALTIFAIERTSYNYRRPYSQNRKPRKIIFRLV